MSPRWLGATVTWGSTRRPRSRTAITAVGGLVALSIVVLAWRSVGGDRQHRLAPARAQGQVVEVVITADNAYGFGWGDAGRMVNYFGGVENTVAGEIFNCPVGNGPEAYEVPVTSMDDYLYIVAWSDDAVTQGVLGRFQVAGDAGGGVLTGRGAWEVYATGIDYDPRRGDPARPGPPLDGSPDSINAQIALANENRGAPDTTSGGWVGEDGGTGDNEGADRGVLAFGEDNRSSVGNFPLVCPAVMGDEARWMWFTRRVGDNAFRGGNHKEYLIFRLPLRDVLTPPPSTPRASDTPTLTPTPSATSTPSATPTLTPTPVPIYLPILLRERCDDTRGFVDVALVLDASTTMREPAEDGRPKIDVAVAAVRGFLDGLRLRPGGDRVALVTFNARGEILQPLSDDRAALDRALETVAVREQSRIDLGIDAGARALGEARPERARALILLTDGLSNPVPGDEAVAAATRAKALDLSMHVIGIGTRRDEAVLRAMASDETTYHDAPSPAVWQEIYAGLAGRLRCPPEVFWGRR